MERICIDTLHSLFYGYPSMRVPPESRMVVKRFPSRHLPLPVGEVASAARTEKGQITATSIGKCWHLRRQMTSRGRKALSVTCGDSSPKGEPRHRILAQEMERICIDTLHSCLQLPLNARAARKSDGRKTVSVPACLSLWERWPAARTERGQNNGNVQSENAGTFARQMTSRGRKALSVTCGDSSPKGGQGIVYWHKKWSVSVSIRSTAPQCACRPKVRWS